MELPGPGGGMVYTVRRISGDLPDSLDCDAPPWIAAEPLPVQHFRQESSEHRPVTTARLLYNDTGLCGLFTVEDRYVRCVHTDYGSPVYRDSCVELFVKPRQTTGYFNFEFNCGGAFLCCYITDPERTADGFREFVRITREDAKGVTVLHSMPRIVEPEIAGPITWSISFFIPFELIGRFAGPLDIKPGQQWKANLFKCGDATSHPHWASWTALPEKNFHLPVFFGTIRFE